MTLPNPQKIIIKSKHIQDSIDCLNKETNSENKTSFTQKAFNAPINNLNIQIFINNNNFKQINFSNESKENNQNIFQTSEISQKKR